MTREEAIAILQKIKPTPCRADGESTTHTLVIIALDMAIKALEQTNVPDKNVGKLDGDPVDIDKAVEHYEGTLATLKGIEKKYAELQESEEV